MAGSLTSGYGSPFRPRRPQDIAATLPLLRDQAVSVVDEHTDVDIVVVDNDPDGSARPFVTSFAAEHGRRSLRERDDAWHLRRRNRALATASDRDVLVFIDDDERPTATWLASLLAPTGSNAAPRWSAR